MDIAAFAEILVIMAGTTAVENDFQMPDIGVMRDPIPQATLGFCPHSDTGQQKEGVEQKCR